jgi:hypothetical protein
MATLVIVGRTSASEGSTPLCGYACLIFCTLIMLDAPYIFYFASMLFEGFQTSKQLGSDFILQKDG